MRARISIAVLMFAIVAGCGGEGGSAATSTSGNQPAPAERGGTITVGDETWTFVPSTQCSVYPGPVVSIAGHAAEESALEVVIDWGGPNQARIAETDSGPGWHAMRDTLNVEVDGKRVKGSATFSEYFTGTGKQAEGTFDIQC